MIFRLGLRRTPDAPTIVRKKYSAACSDDDRILFVFDVNRRDRQIERERLTLPREPAVLCSKYRVIVPDRETRKLIFCKMNCVERIALRERILPCPALAGAELGVRTYYESQNRTPYAIRTELNMDDGESATISARRVA